jgi:hypothetical protein
MEFEALVAIADLVKDADDAKETADAAVKLLSNQLGAQKVSPWLLARLVRICLARDVGESSIASIIGHRSAGPLRGWCQLQVFHAKLKAGEVTTDDAEKVEGLSSGLAWFDLARHMYGKDSGVIDAVEKWDEKHRGFGLLGVLTAKKEAK